MTVGVNVVYDTPRLLLLSTRRYPTISMPWTSATQTLHLSNTNPLTHSLPPFYPLLNSLTSAMGKQLQLSPAQTGDQENLLN